MMNFNRTLPRHKVMDTIYSMYGVYLYDNQLNHDYLIFYNNKNLDIFHIT
jgi:hypothetical protein